MSFYRVVKAGTASVTVPLKVIDSTLGTPETGVTYTTTGIALWYRRQGAAVTAITEATQTASGAFASGGFVHLSDGRCRLDLPNAATVTGAVFVEYGGTITGMIVIGGVVDLVTNDPYGTFNVNVAKINATTVTGAGTATSKWGPA